MESQISDKPVCLRCGSCCWYRDTMGHLRKCRFLIKVGERTFCRIYANRLGTIVGVGEYGIVYCMERKDHHVNYPNCPYNIEGQPTL